MKVSSMGRVGAVALMVGFTGVFSSPRAASGVSPISCTGHGPFTAGMLDVSCVIDPDLTGIHVVAVGAPGGSVTADNLGGKGAVVTADIAVSAGATIFLNVGGAGPGIGITGGANGGGAGGTLGAGQKYGAAGGGASDLRMPSNAITDRVLVAGGGGGSGFSEQNPAAYPGANADGGSGGFLIGGTSAAGSTPGRGGSSGSCIGSDGGTPASGQGGAGFSLGAGGGGGLAGGGGGGEPFTAGTCADDPDGGGGGGSSLVPTGGSRATDTTGTPLITITAPVPATTSGPTISGSTVVGQTLTESHAQWSNTPTAFAVQWLRCDTAGTACLPIGTGATTYTLTADDVGHTIKAQETASNFYGSSLTTGTAGTATSTPTAVVTAAAIPPPTITATSPACQQIEAAVTNNSSAATAVQYTVTATSGSTSISKATDGTAQPGQTNSVRISGLPSGGTYTVTAKGDDGSATAEPATVTVAECRTVDFKAKIGKGHFAGHFARVKLINRGSNVAVPVKVVSVHHSSHQYNVKANEVLVVHAFIAPHGHSKIKVIDKSGVEAKRKFVRPRQ
jgi:hypothetical protein